MAGTPITVVNLEQKISETGLGQGDLMRALYDLYTAVYGICQYLDNSGSNYLTGIGTPLKTALGDKIAAPHGGTTSGS